MTEHRPFCILPAPVLAAWAHLTPSARGAAVALGTHINPSGARSGHCSASVARCAAIAGLDRRSVQRGLRALETLGLAVKLAPARQHRPAVYSWGPGSTPGAAGVSPLEGSQGRQSARPLAPRGGSGAAAEEPRGDTESSQGRQREQPRGGTQPALTTQELPITTQGARARGPGDPARPEPTTPLEAFMARWGMSPHTTAVDEESLKRLSAQSALGPDGERRLARAILETPRAPTRQAWWAAVEKSLSAGPKPEQPPLKGLDFLSPQVPERSDPSDPSDLSDRRQA